MVKLYEMVKHDVPKFMSKCPAYPFFFTSVGIVCHGILTTGVIIYRDSVLQAYGVAYLSDGKPSGGSYVIIGTDLASGSYDYIGFSGSLSAPI